MRSEYTIEDVGFRVNATDPAEIIRRVEAMHDEASAVNQRLEVDAEHGALDRIDDLIRQRDTVMKQNAEISEIARGAHRDRDAWAETARHHLKNECFYHDLVCQIGECFGVEAKTSDDGSLQQDVLALLVPVLVKRLVDSLDAFQRLCDAAVTRAKESR